MINKLFIVFIFLFSFHYVNAECKEVKCDTLRVVFFPYHIIKQDTILWHLNSYLKLDLSNIVDTLKLTTNVGFNGDGSTTFGPKDLQSWIVKDKKQQKLFTTIVNRNTGTLFHDQQFIKVFPIKSNIINLDYNIIGSSCFTDLLMRQNFPYVYTFHYNNEKFYPQNLRIQNFDVFAPDSFYIFKSLDHNLHQDDINISFISKNYITKDTLNVNNISIDIFTRTSSLSHSHVDSIKCFFRRILSDIKYDSNCKKFQFVLVPYHGNRCEKYGMAFGNYAVFDENFKYKDMLHEFLHMFLNYNVVDGSPGEFFMKESIIEWLACYYSNFEDPIRKKIYYNKNNLYNLHHNGNNEEEYGVVYNNGLAILNIVARKCTKKKLADCILSYINSSKSRFVTYDDFLNYAKRKIDPDLLRKMDLMVKGKMKIL